MQNRTLTISGYEWRLKKYFREFYKAGARYSLRVSLFRDIWDLDDIGYKRMHEALRRLYKKKILVKPIINGKEIRGGYKWNPVDPTRGATVERTRRERCIQTQEMKF